MKDGAMESARLTQDWTDTDGTAHQAGDTVTVDAETLAQLRAIGFVSDIQQEAEEWSGPTEQEQEEQWNGPTYDSSESWAGPDE